MLLTAKILVGILFLLITQIIKWNVETDGTINDDIAKIYAIFAGCASFTLTWSLVKSGLYMLVLYIVELIRYMGSDRGYKRSTITHILLYSIELIGIVVLMGF